MVQASLEQNGASAVMNIQYAKENLEELNFSKAAESFSLAYDDFSSATSTLDKVGASFFSAIGSIPGFEKMDTASNLAEAGKSIAKAGENLSLAFSTLSDMNVLAMLDPNNQTNTQSATALLKDFKEVLVFAQKHITRANRLLNDVYLNFLP